MAQTRVGAVSEETQDREGSVTRWPDGVGLAEAVKGNFCGFVFFSNLCLPRGDNHSNEVPDSLLWLVPTLTP
jgi:hypothetical protein